MGGWEGELCCGQLLQIDTNTGQFSHDEVATAVLDSKQNKKLSQLQPGNVFTSNYKS